MYSLGFVKGTPGCVPNGPQLDTRPKGPNWWRSTQTDSYPDIVSTIPVDSEGVWTWDRWHWKGYLLSFPYICGSLKTEFECILGINFNADWSRTPSWAQSGVGLGFQLVV